MDYTPMVSLSAIVTLRKLLAEGAILTNVQQKDRGLKFTRNEQDFELDERGSMYRMDRTLVRRGTYDRHEDATNGEVAGYQLAGGDDIPF